MEKKTKLTISGTAKKTIKNIDIENDIKNGDIFIKVFKTLF